MKRMLMLIPLLLLATACGSNDNKPVNVLRTNMLTQRLESHECLKRDYPKGYKAVSVSGGMFSTYGSGETVSHRKPRYSVLTKDGEWVDAPCTDEKVYNERTLLLFIGENDQMWKCTVDAEFYSHFYTGLTADIPVERCREVKP